VRPGRVWHAACAKAKKHSLQVHQVHLLFAFMSLDHELVVFHKFIMFIKFILVSHKCNTSGWELGGKLRLATDVRRQQKLPYNVHDIQEPSGFSSLGHERRTFPHVHDIHDVHDMKSANSGFCVPVQSSLSKSAARQTGRTHLIRLRRASDFAC
jgi:hypothetical protein